ncbi:MAG: hypothetical protein A3F10_00320 [Coxiella sp. RIFCSPHIGHO2_12_FULL_42_15]|nr:MAG: hypothetical protein A3F10_00320 [Coxiella sp. RIFCSPHIGHO2_12_FULL_42_15]
MINYEKALLDPQGVCENPKNVVTDASLTKAQKLEILEQWKQDAILLQIAEEENMAPSDPTSSTMLGRVERAILAIKTS